MVKPEFSRVVHNLVTAIDEKRKVKLTEYHSANSNSITDREIEPFCFTTNYEQIWGYEIRTGKNKLFKVARIRSVELLDELWENEHKHAETKIDVFRISGRSYIGKAILELNVRAPTTYLLSSTHSPKNMSQTKTTSSCSRPMCAATRAFAGMFLAFSKMLPLKAMKG